MTHCGKGDFHLKKGCFRGDVAQLGERYVRNVQAGGSIPPISTKRSRGLWPFLTRSLLRGGETGSVEEASGSGVHEGNEKEER